MTPGETILSQRIADELTLRGVHGLGWITATSIPSGVDVVSAIEHENTDPEVARFKITVEEIA